MSSSSSTSIGAGTVAVASQSPSLYLVRHGERAAFRQRSGKWDQAWAEGRSCPHDDPLTPLGKQQAAHAATCILENQDKHNLAPLKRVICSPFVRCVQTGFEIARKLNVPLFVDYSLCERLKEEWFKPEYMKFEDIYLTVDKLAELKDEINSLGEIGAPFSELKLFDDLPLDCIPSTYENDEHEKDMPRPKNIAVKLNKHASTYASSVLVSHGGVAYWIAHALCAEVGRDAKDFGTVHYCGTACFTLKPPNDTGVSVAANNGNFSEKWHPLVPFESPLRFTPKQNWCQAHEWKKMLGPLLPNLRESSPHHPNLRVLELGAWEGLSAKFWKGFFGTASQLVVVDHFDLYNEDDEILKKGTERLKKFHWNLQLTGEHDSVTLLQDFTFRALTTVIIPQRMTFDFIYIDADHSTIGVLSDAMLAWQCLRKGGLMLFDDYQWPGFTDDDGIKHSIAETHAEHPKRGIDAFLATHKEQLETVYSGYQVLVRKTVDHSFPFPESSLERVVSLSSDNDDQGGSEESKDERDSDDSSSSSGSKPSTIAVLLPLTSRGQTPSQLQSSLKEFEACLPPPSQCVIMLGLDDDDDEYLLGEEGNCMLGEVFRGYQVHKKVFKPQSPPRICEMANELAKMAFHLQDLRCDYFVLLGDDVRIEPKRNWIKHVDEAFESLHGKLIDRFGQYVSSADLKGLGVVALNDVTFTGFPTFPIVSRKHLEMFQHQLSPEGVFINQDMDPFIWAVYRPFGARLFAPNITLRNTIGGESQPRYERQHVDWKNEVLDQGIDNVQQYLLNAMKKNRPNENDSQLVSHLEQQKLVTLDVIVPTYRGIESILRGILSLPTPDDASICFIIIVDDPTHRELRTTLERDFNSRVLVRVNEENQGASYSRNQGIDESSAKWNVFIDDDVVPHPWVLIEYVKAIREKGHRAAGFVGLSCLPAPNSYITAGLTISYLTYFWRVAEVKIGGEEAPWAVTANVCARRGHTRFDPVFAKTGGGEDIAYLRLVKKEFQLPLIKAPKASVEHPWWTDGFGGQPHPRRYFRWAKSDVILMDEEYHPEHTFYSWPAFWEFVIMWTLIGLPLMVYCVPLTEALFKFVVGVSALVVCESAADVYEACKEDHGAAPSIVGWQRKYCALLGCVFKNFCEAGHVYGPLRNRRWQHFCKRFDWWYGLNLTYVQERREKERNRAACFLLLLAISLSSSTSYAVSWITLFMSFAVTVTCFVSFLWPGTQDPNEKKSSNAMVAVSPAPTSSNKPLHLAFVADENYAHHLAVALKSLLNHGDSANHLRIHIVDAGISKQSWNQLRSIVDHIPHVQLHRHEIPKNIAGYLNIGAKSSPKWMKLWLDKILPNLDQVLYLDCDILIKGDLTQIWDRLSSVAEDVASYPVHAVVDFGLPQGEKCHKTFGWNAKDSYFNAGVMLLDLSVWRKHGFGQCLRALARDFSGHPSLPYSDQDVLNLVFRNRWKALDLKFNMQGLGSYAEDRCKPPYHGHTEKGLIPYGFRPQLFQDEKELKLLQQQAVIVHFTGTNAPSLSQVMNPHVKVATKPDAWFTHLPPALVKEYFQLLSQTPFAHRWKASSANAETRAKLAAALADDDTSISLASAMLTDLNAMILENTIPAQLVKRAASIVAHRTLVDC